MEGENNNANVGASTPWWNRTPPQVNSARYEDYFRFRPVRELPAALPDIRNTLLVVFALGVPLFYSSGLSFPESLYSHVSCFEIFGNQTICIAYAVLMHEVLMCMGLNTTLVVMSYLFSNFPFKIVIYFVLFVISFSFSLAVSFLSSPRPELTGGKEIEPLATALILWVTTISVWVFLLGVRLCGRVCGRPTQMGDEEAANGDQVTQTRTEDAAATDEAAKEEEEGAAKEKDEEATKKEDEMIARTSEVVEDRTGEITACEEQV